MAGVVDGEGGAAADEVAVGAPRVGDGRPVGWDIGVAGAKAAGVGETVGDVGVPGGFVFAEASAGDEAAAFGEVELGIAKEGDVGKVVAVGVDLGDGVADDMGALGVADGDEFGGGAFFDALSNVIGKLGDAVADAGVVGRAGFEDDVYDGAKVDGDGVVPFAAVGFCA